MIEYTLIAVLVILGIVIMGPYVLRSVNAHFKLWDVSVKDSYTEHLAQAPVNAIPNIPTNCSCQRSKGSCGSAVSRCGPNQREYDFNCIPQGCNGAVAPPPCEIDPTCCTTYSAQGCGTIPCPAGGCALAPTSPPPAANNCYFGQSIMATQCATLPISCSPNPSCPLPACLGILSPGAFYCATGTATPPTGLLQNFGITYVAGKVDCPSSPHCQLYCDTDNSFIINPSGTGCARTFQVAPVPSHPSNVQSTTSTPLLGSPGSYSFKICAPNANTIITAISVSASPPGQPTKTPIDVSGTDGCQSPGEPGNTCKIAITY
jgi:hypothetical protein